MQFILDGPDIPLDVLTAQEEDRLVLFCGAGISMPAGLPSFRDLVEKIYEGLGATRTPVEDAEWSRESYDRVLNLLEGNGRFSPSQVRGQVRSILTTPAHPVLDTHRAILDLARDRTARIRLVTTNFDGLFQAADPDVRVMTAPLLPVPKFRKWNGVVHLHGRLDDGDTEGLNLVLTSADFGVAYLVERWASRFVGELFRHCSVLFVGYGVNDPVMRYLIDAIAAERRFDKNLHPAYALASFKTGQRVEAETEWSGRGITPILYDGSDGHSRLHRTLKEWAGIWSGGLISKRSIVRTLAQQDPTSLPEEAISQFCWAVGDPSGAMARELAQLKRAAMLAWLPVLEQRGLLIGPPDPRTMESIALVDDGRTTGRIPSLDPVRFGLAAWLSEHVSDPALARWAVAAGGRLHPELRELIRRKLGAVALSAALRKIWLVLVSAAPLRARSTLEHFDLLGRIGTESWGPILRGELLGALSPCLEVHSAWTSIERALEGEDAVAAENDLAVADILSFDCELEAGNLLEPMLERFLGRPDGASILADLAYELTGLLRRALDLHAMLNGASEDYDPSYIQHPSIAPHEQNRHHRGWTRLVDLLRDAYDAVRERDHARSLVEAWSRIPYPLFRRLVLYGFSHRDPSGAPAALRILATDPQRWLWSFAVQAELFAALSWLSVHLDGSDREYLIGVLLEGPPRTMFREGISPAEWDELQDHSIWARLARMRRGGASLGATATERLSQIETAHPDWQLTGDDRDEFPAWMETRAGLPSDFSGQELLARNDEALLQVLKEHRQNREGLLDSWQYAADQDRPRALRVLRSLLEERHLDSGVWSHGLAPFRELAAHTTLRADLLGLLELLPAELMREVVRPVADAIRALSEGIDDALRPRALSLWDTAVGPSFTVAPMNSDDRVTDAINHPTGVLAEALFHLLRSRTLQRSSGVEQDVRLRLESLIGATEVTAQLGRVIVASRLPLLHDLDPDWTTRLVVPLFDWKIRDEAKGAWQGFLWSPWLRLSLWAVLKEHFLAACEHVEELGRSKENLAAILASISIEGEEAISSADAGRCLRRLGESGRAGVALWIHQRLRDAEGQAASLWRGRIGPWLRRAWPREPGLRSPGASERLAWAVTLTGEAFPEAVHLVSQLVGPIEHANFILEAMAENHLIAIATDACLELVNAFTPSDPAGWFGDLGRFLDSVRSASSELAADARFQRLEEIAIRRGL